MFDKNKNRMQQQQRPTFKNFEAASRHISNDFNLDSHLDSHHIPFDSGNSMSSSWSSVGGKPAMHLAHHNKPHLSSRNVAILSSQLENDAIAGGLISARVNNNSGSMSTSANVLSFVEQAFGVMNNFPSSLSNDDSLINNNNGSICAAKTTSFHNGSSNMKSPLDSFFGNDGVDDLVLNKSCNPRAVTNHDNDITNVIGSDVAMFQSGNALPVALDDSFFDM